MAAKQIYAVHFYARLQCLILEGKHTFGSSVIEAKTLVWDKCEPSEMDYQLASSAPPTLCAAVDLDLGYSRAVEGVL